MYAGGSTGPSVPVTMDDEFLRVLVDLLRHHDAYCSLKTDGKTCGHPATTDVRALAVVRARAELAAVARQTR